MKEKENNNIDCFIEKYKTSNPLAKLLIKKFFLSIGSLIPCDAENILEVGCGAGFSTQYLSKITKGKHLYASDINPKLAEIAQQQNPSILIEVESVYNLQGKDNSFDLIIALEVLEHLEKPMDALSELHRVTAKYAIISVPREPLWRILNIARGKYIKNFGNTPGHINHWSVSGFRNFVRNYFKIKEVRTPLPWIVVLAEKNEHHL